MLANDVWKILERLGDEWFVYLREAGLPPLTRESFLSDLTETIQPNFELPGLEDFCRTARRGVEPGDPAKSLLYHALASPGVILDCVPDERYPRPEELDVVENFVYSLARASVEDLQVKAGNGPLAIVVFAYEYCPANDTVHRRHADLCFSRTGIARVGNEEPRYMPKSRGFLPNHETDTTRVHVVPCRYAAFIATKKKGDKSTIGPERFQKDDDKTDFWVPLHKLFDGDECIAGMNLKVELQAHHLNEKIKRIHVALSGYPWDSEEISSTNLTGHPFRITRELADFRRMEDRRLLIPYTHPLIEFAKDDHGNFVTFRVPPNFARYGSSITWLHDQRGARRAPELVYVKYALKDGRPDYLPERQDKTFPDILTDGNYDAIHTIDYTADGWISAACRELAVRVPKTLSAYSVIGPPDFFPLVKQQDLVDWWEKDSPEDIRKHLWSEDDTGPDSLSSSRMPPNLRLAGANFDPKDTTLTAIVGVFRHAEPAGRIRPTPPKRESTLSGRAANVFQPGWDTSNDYLFNGATGDFPGPMFLANYGLSSPFAQDLMVCAFGGAFWPGAVPDSTREFGQGGNPTVTPIDDSLLGWDGVPRSVRQGATLINERVAYTDYVRTVIDGKLKFGAFAKTDLESYLRITVAMARVYQVLKVSTFDQRAKWVVFSFRRATHQEIYDAAVSAKLDPPFAQAYRFEMFLTSAQRNISGDRERNQADILQEEVLIANPALVLRNNPKPGDWIATEF